MLKPERITDAHVFAFFFINYVGESENGLEVSEIFKIMEKVEEKVKLIPSNRNIEVVVWQTVQETMNWYMSLSSEQRNEQCIEMCDRLKDMLTVEQKLNFLDDLVEIGKVNNKFVTAEREMICTTAEHWDIQYDIA